MTCETVKPLLSEFQDDALDAATAWQVQTHLTECGACLRISRDLRSLGRMLSDLPARQPSAAFEASLAQRLALTRRPEKRQTWRDRLRRAFPSPRLRPALALGAGVAAAAGMLFFPLSPVSTPPAPPAAHAGDHAFVADCVAQHRREAGGEPLADMAAQNLAGQLDSAPPPAAGADAELF